MNKTGSAEKAKPKPLETMPDLLFLFKIFSGMILTITEGLVDITAEITDL